MVVEHKASKVTQSLTIALSLKAPGLALYFSPDLDQRKLQLQLVSEGPGTGPVFLARLRPKEFQLQLVLVMTSA